MELGKLLSAVIGSVMAPREGVVDRAATTPSSVLRVLRGEAALHLCESPGV